MAKENEGERAETRFGTEKDILRRTAALRALHGRTQRQTGSQQIDRIGSPANVLTSETIGARPDRPAY